MNVAYLRSELTRLMRNRRFLVFSFGFPLLLFFLIAGPNRNEHNLGGSGISAPLYFMVGLAAFGSMNSMLAGGARIAAERSIGWNRQLRLTPLPPRTYFRTKVLTAYSTALASIVLLDLAGTALGVRLGAGDWLRMTGLMLVGLIPFAALGEVVRRLAETLDLITFFTAGEKETRAWTLRRGETALDAAGTIHTDIARGFIRCEVIRWDDLVKAGSHQEAARQGLQRLETKTYVVEDGDVLNIRFNV